MKYLKHKFFFDVHPPLGKLLFASVFKWVGYEGDFSFATIGLEYEPDVPYVKMRILSASFGAMLAPFAFISLQSAGFSLSSSVLATLLVVLDSALTLQFRFILLDSFLVCFIAGTACFWIRFQSRNEGIHFGFGWFLDLFLVGVFLGLTNSVKSIGLFTTAWIGFRTLLDLYSMLSDTRIGVFRFIGHFLARAFCLILVPLTIYLACFYVHFEILTHSGPGDNMMSLDFQKGLIGNANRVANVQEVGMGSVISLKHLNSDNVFLQSTHQTYPAGSRHHQITGTFIRDGDCRWVVYPSDKFISDGQ